ncbi:MAG TPA: RNA-guided endonuclease TnpB family protein [Acidimicrobiia bacterium]|jgi:putative transposase
MVRGQTLVLDREVAFRFALDLSGEQQHLAWQLAGSRRWVYNQLLDGVHARMDARVWEAELGTEPWTPWGWGRLDLIRQVKALRAAHPWLAAQPWDVAECAAVDLATALKNYSESRRGERKGRRVGFPKCKSRKAPRQSFRLRHPGQIHVDGTTLTLPGLASTPLGTVKVHGPTRRLRRLLAGGRFRAVSVTISFEHHRWSVSITGLAANFHPARRTHARGAPAPDRLRPAKSAVPVGVDLGVRTLATAADTNGVPVQVWEGVKPLRAAQRKLRRANKALARTKPGSKGRRRAVDKLRRVHARVHSLRQNLLHEVSTRLVDHHQTVVVEDLNVAGMLADRRLALGTADQAMGTLRRLLTYKAAWYGTDLVIADRFYPSTKTCSSCGHVHDGLGRGDTHWTCPRCGTSHDRDHNAAVNLARWPTRNQRQVA